jgi:nitrogen fixation protein NifU and related proteins
MSDALYSLAVLRLAAEACGDGRLAAPDGSHTEHNPACGDRSTIDLKITGGTVSQIAQQTRACVLTQASASILGASLPGLDYARLVKLRGDVAAMLKSSPAPDEPFARYAALKDAANYPGRHKCVLLPIDAAIKAFENSQDRQPDGERPKA